MKKGSGADFFTFWVEGFFILLLIGGFLIAAFIKSVPLTYLVGFLAGLLFGKMIYHNKKDAFAHYILLTIGFIIGYTVGNSAGDWKLTAGLFIAGVVVSYFLHEKKIF